MAKLLVQESQGAREFELVDLEVNIGRELDNALRLADPSISRHHAVIRQGTGGYEIQDLQSSNGVLLNGVRVAAAQLKDGDRITLGQMQMTFLDPLPVASPLGTVMMKREELERSMASTGTGSATGAIPIPAPPPESKPIQLAVPPPPAAVPARPRPAPVPPNSTAPALGKPGPGFLHPFLPDIPDPAQPIRDANGAIERGDLLTRFLAALIDYAPALVLSVIATILTMAVAPMGGFGALAGIGCLFGLLQLALGVCYLILIPLYWMRVGASPGKKIMKLRVVLEADPAGRLDLSGAVLRMLGYLVNGIISGIIMMPVSFMLLAPLGFGSPFHPMALLWSRLIGLVVGLVPYLLILGPERKGLEDYFSKSIVIKVDR